MEYRLLGSVRVRDADGREVPLVRPKHRQVLVALLVNANRAVPAGHLAEHLWDGAAPRSARGNLKTYVSALRRLLSPEDCGAAPIETVGDGYRLVVRPGELDLLTFRDLARQGRDLLKAGEVRQGEAALRRAFLLWRDDPFEGVPLTLLLEQIAAGLREERLGVFEDWAGARLDLGLHAEVVGPLRQCVRDHPLRERPWGLLMLALARDGRRADALAAFQELRTRLVEDLGVEPGHPVQLLHRRILAGDADPTPVVPAPDVEARARHPAVPRQLPSGTPHFVGREGELNRLENWLNPPDGSPPTPVVAICGPPGAGKSALALHAAHRAAARFPDGQVYVNLRGAMPGVRRLDTGELIGRLLRTFGTPGSEVPPDVDEAASALRTLLHGRRVLLLLDDASSIAQTGPLLPMTSGSTVLLTSRENLAPAAPASHVDLGRMPRDEAVAMLVRRFRSGGVGFSQKAVERLADLCDGFPLALHIAGARLASRSGWSADMLIERLEDESGRLDELRTGEVGVRSSIAVSHTALAGSGQDLDREAARAFRLIGLLRVPDLGTEAVTVLLERPPRAAARVIERLVDARLVESPAPGRYTMHDLIRLYAQERALDTEPPDRREAALRRVLGFLLATTSAAVRVIDPHRLHAAVPEVPQTPKPLRDRDEATRWLERERANLLTIVGQAWDADAATARLAVGLALSLQWHLAAQGYRHEMLWLGTRSLQTARRLADQGSEAQALAMVAMAHRLLNHDADELKCLNDLLDLCRKLADPLGELRALGNLASACLLQERPEEVLRYAERQLDISRRVGSPVGERYALMMVGDARLALGFPDEAVATLRQALRRAREAGDAMHEAMTLRRLGEAYLAAGDAVAARAHLRDSLASFDACAQGPQERSQALVALARSSRMLGDLDGAARHLAESLRIARESGDRHDERRALAEQAEMHGHY
ncbi:AfsR/SARP family transcriptional regulator [Microbispora amethystogenes]|uniref:SARP family transcriptional regulator n=1 Tax=Microbispora amethystogenes TaxID=1427754 RepID=A0ABQ4FBI6_9ACTN|nr:BTAD domain-containing putative transcriptional regulator [Microbispora amethystogenes]GIH32154.1 SARP family transcriptional regulator [Microbispora amethystogenes]